MEHLRKIFLGDVQVCTPVNESKQTKEPTYFDEFPLLSNGILDLQDMKKFYHTPETILATVDAIEQSQKLDVSNSSQDSSTIASEPKQASESMDYYEFQKIIEDKYRIISPDFYDRITAQAQQMYKSDKLSEEFDPRIISLATAFDEEEELTETAYAKRVNSFI